jgi:adenylate cyclase
VVLDEIGGAVTDDVDAADSAESAEWRHLLVDGHRPIRIVHRVFRRLPGPPRCKLCHNPFGGVGGRVVAVAGFRPSPKNPNFCTQCCDKLPAGGATVDVSVLFADVRGSTSLGEQVEPREFATALRRFYDVATETLIAHDAIIDKLIGDEVMALFVPGIAGMGYRKKSVRAALDLARDLQGLELDAGVAAHAGEAYVGRVGSADIIDFTALGDTVNTAARLQSHAGPGQVVVSAELGEHLAAEHAGQAQRSLTLKGRAEPLDVHVVSI